MDRFYIDGRGGCVAVRDSLKVNEEDQGLHPDMSCVVAFWDGYKTNDSKGRIIWATYAWQQEKAQNLAELLNRS